MEKKEKNKHLGLHIDEELHQKLRYVAEYDGRSMNGEVLYLIRQYLSEFEKLHGKILPNEE